MLNYRVDGDGPPLLLLHGFGISFNIWRDLTPLLGDHFTVVTAELPGIGLSPLPPPTRPYLAAAADALDSLRENLAIPRWSVIGYSSGSRVAEAYVRSHAQRVERIAFLAPALANVDKSFGLRIASTVDGRFPRLGNWILSGARLRFLIHLLGFNLQPNPAVDAWLAEISSQPVEILKATLRSLPDFGARPFDVPNQIPALFIWGREDIITKTPRRPSAHDVIIRATHAMPQTKPREVGEILLSFLKK
ncbi:MAG: alpha/beta fold hydrolase [Chloroflexota bacterium]